MKVTQEQLTSFQKEIAAGKWVNQRLGQAFCNKFGIKDDTVLFYNQNDGDALRIIWEQYTKILENDE